MALANYKNTLEEDVYMEEEEEEEFVMNQNSTDHSSQSSSNSSHGFMFQGSNYNPQDQSDQYSLINFMSANQYSSSSVTLEDDYQNYELNNPNSFKTETSWLYSSNGSIVADSNIHDQSMSQDHVANYLHKRPHMGENGNYYFKKQCTKRTSNTIYTSTSTAAKKPKSKLALTKDPQSIAAKNRRERISEKLKVLQELIPNGSKVDMVTMLEKAISYVQFLQLQVKVLATDEFWPSQGGKAPDIAQVKEAINAILSSRRPFKV